MSSHSSDKLYEKFHTTTSKHKHLVNCNDFTHGPLITILNRYVSENEKILDLGCGTGSIDFYLASKGFRVTGIDISKRAIESCKQNANQLGLEKNTHFSVSTIEKFSSRSIFDLVLCIEVIEHIKDDKKVLKKIHNLLKKNI